MTITHIRNRDLTDELTSSSKICVNSRQFKIVASNIVKYSQSLELDVNFLVKLHLQM